MQSTFASITTRWITEIETGNAKKGTPVMLIGAKSDNPSRRQVTHAEGKVSRLTVAATAAVLGVTLEH